MLKLQETPETVPTGEMPWRVLVVVERGLVDKVPPDMQVSLMAIVSLFNNAGSCGERMVVPIKQSIYGW